MQNIFTYCINGRFLPAFNRERTRFIMRVSVFIISLIAISGKLLLAAPGYGQGKEQTAISLNVKNAPVQKVFEAIENKAGVVIMYENTGALKNEKVTLSVKDKKIADILNLILKDKGLKWNIRDNVIRIEAAEPVSDKSATTGFLPSLSNNITVTKPITGRITDSTGAPLVGATVAILGKPATTFTDDNGRFTIDAEVGDIIMVSYVGYRAVTIKVNAQTNNISLRLSQTATHLEEVAVVSTGYQTIPKERATGSFEFVNNQLFNRRVSTDVLSRLEGVVPGLLFNRNTIGGATKTDISIRGNSTLYANNQPLIVVDGFPYDGDLSNINPNTVESISVLKDAAAASIWGVRSGNGVIVIQTKHGSRNKPMTIGFNTNVTVGEKPYIFKDPNFLDANDFINVEQELFSRGYYDAAINTHTDFVSPVVQILAEQRAGKIDAATANSQISALRNNDVRHDVSDYLYRKSVNQQYALTMTGGGNKSDYFFSAGYDKNISSQIGNKNERINLNVLNNFYPVKNLQLSIGVNYTQQHTQNNAPNINFTLYPYTKLADANGNPLSVPTGYGTLSEAFKDSMANNGFLDWKYRPLEEFDKVDNMTRLVDNRINLGARYEVIPGLSADVKYQYERQSVEQKNYSSIESYYVRNLINRYMQPNAAEKYPIPLGGILASNNGYLTSHRLRGQLSFNQTWKQKHSLSAIAGAEINEIINESENSTTYGYNKETRSSSAFIDYVNWYPLNPNGIDRIPNNLGYGKATDHFISYYANAAYTYKNRYTVSASGRLDRSNLFGVNTNQKNVPLYSTGLAWEISKESFYKWGTMPYLKLRATYGYNGNINKSATAQATISQANNSYFFGQTYATIANPGNPELRWEKVRVLNLGLDFTAKNHVLSGSIEYYTKKGLDLFGNSPLAPSTGLNTFFGNVANTKGHGWDIVLNTNQLNGRNFQWTTNLTFSQAVDKLTDYNQDIASSITYIRGSNASSIYPIVGKPFYGIYSYRWAGLTHDTGDPQGYLDGKPSTDYANIMKNATIDSLVFNGSARPTIYGAFRNRFSYKEFTLSFNIVYKLNYFFRRATISYNDLYLYGKGHVDFAKKWQKPGDELTTNIPSIQYPPINSDRETFYMYSDAFVEKGDHIRLQDISVSYDVIRGLEKKRFFTLLQIYGYVNNVGILWKSNKMGLDPDIFTGIPNPRTYTIGVKAEF